MNVNTNGFAYTDAQAREQYDRDMSNDASIVDLNKDLLTRHYQNLIDKRGFKYPWRQPDAATVASDVVERKTYPGAARLSSHGYTEKDFYDWLNKPKSKEDTQSPYLNMLRSFPHIKYTRTAPDWVEGRSVATNNNENTMFEQEGAPEYFAERRAALNPDELATFENQTRSEIDARANKIGNIYNSKQGQRGIARMNRIARRRGMNEQSLGFDDLSTNEFSVNANNTNWQSNPIHINGEEKTWEDYDDMQIQSRRLFQENPSAYMRRRDIKLLTGDRNASDEQIQEAYEQLMKDRRAGTVDTRYAGDRRRARQYRRAAKKIYEFGGLLPKPKYLKWK